MTCTFVITGWNSIGGGEKRLARLALYMMDSNEDVTLLVNKGVYEQLEKQEIIKQKNDNIIVVKEASCNYDTWYSTPVLRQLWVLYLSSSVFFHLIKLKSRRIHFCGFHDLVIFFNTFFFTATSASIVDSNFFTLINSKYKAFLYRFIFNNVRSIDCLSTDIANSVISFSPRNCSKVKTAPCSFIDHHEPPSWDSKKNIVTFLGSLKDIKNPELFLDAAIELSEENELVRNNWFFRLYGKGPLEGHLRNKIASQSKNVNNIQIIYTDNPVYALRESKIFCSLQETNNYPSQSMIEAMSNLNAIIATDVGETRMLCNEQNSILIDKSLVALKSAILSLIKDDQLLKNKAVNADQIVRKTHTIENFSSYFIENIFSNWTANK